MTDNQVKVGDELAFCGGYGRGHWSIHTVSRITPSGRVVCGPYTLNPDLTVRGRSYGSPYKAVEVTDRIREKVARQEALSILAHFSMDKLSTEALLKIVEITESGKQ